MHKLFPSELTESTGSMELNNSQATGMFSSNLVGGGSKKKRLRKKRGSKRNFFSKLFTFSKKRSGKRYKKQIKTKSKRRRYLRGGNPHDLALASPSTLTFGELTSCRGV